MKCPYCEKDLKITNTETLDNDSQNILCECKDCQYYAFVNVKDNEETLKKYKKCYYTKDELKEVKNIFTKEDTDD